MQAILIEPKDLAEYNLLSAMFQKMNIRMKTLNLSDEEREDLGLSILMQEVDWNDTVSRDAIMAKLRKPKI